MRCAVVLLAMVVGSATTVAAQSVVQARRPTGEVALSLNGRDSERSNETRVGVVRFFEGVSLATDGHVLYPGLLKFNLRFAPVFSQSNWNFTPDISEVGGGERSTRLYGQFGIHALSAQPLSLSAWIRRRRLDWDGRQDVSRLADLSDWGGEIRLRNRALPGRITYQHQHVTEDWARSSGDTRYDWTQSRLRFEASNSKTQLFLQRVSNQNVNDAYDLSLLDGRFRHALRWGKGSSLKSSLYYARRERLQASSFFSVTENARLQHTHRLRSTYGFLLTRQDNGIFDGRSIGGSIGADYSVTPEFLLGIRGEALGRSANDGDVTGSEYRLLPRIQYGTRLPAGLRFGASVEAGYQWQSVVGAAEGQVPVFEESHLVPDGLSFLLGNAEIDPGTVRVWSANRSIEYTRDFDYMIIGTGVHNELLILPGGRIARGETVLVDYAYTARVDEDRTGGVLNSSLSISGKSFQAYHRRAYNAYLPGLQPYTGIGFQGIDYSITGVSLTARKRLATISTGFEHNYTRGRTTRVESYRAFASASLLVDLKTTATLAGSWSRSNVWGSRTDMVRGDARLVWRPSRFVQARARLSGHEIVTTTRSDRGFVTGGAALDIFYRQLQTTIQFERILTTDNGTRTENRLWVTLRRAF
ncbi:hypothetical protein ACFL5T_04175 [Gemmatimonadota bacterium]